MKKLLLITSFLASQLFAIECPEEQYSLFFTDTEEVRYITAGYMLATNDKVVFDKKSVKFDKKNQTIKAWGMVQTKSELNSGVIKILYEFDIKNNNWRYSDAIISSCEGNSLGYDKYLTWEAVSPESSTELLLVKLKEYLNLK